MKKYLIPFLLLFILVACKGRKTSLKGDDEVNVTDFIEFYPAVSLPYRVSDTTLSKRPYDSLEISYSIFKQFVPDSVLMKTLGKTVNLKFYAMGRIAEKGKETYLFTEVIQENRHYGYLCCFSKDNEFLKAMVLVKTGTDAFTSTYGLLDNKFQITTYRERKKSNGDITYKRNVYFYNSSANTFTLIFTEPNEEMIQNIINPIESLPRKNRFAGDYIRDRRNFISVRDGKNPSEVLFFIHFETPDNCTGELKGNARFISPAIARYQEHNNPCSVELIFTNSRVSMKETGGCGTFRDIKCFFDGSFPRKREVIKRQEKSKSQKN